MLKKSITYVNSDTGKQETKDYYFNLTKVELAELEYSIPGGFDSIRDEITNQLNEGRIIIGALLDAYKMIVAKAVGFRTPEGKFSKSKDFREAFLASDAYSELILELMNVENESKITDFFNKVVVGMPDDVKVKAAEEAEKYKLEVISAGGDVIA